MSNYYKRNELWRKLKRLSPNNTPSIDYIYSSKNVMIAEIAKISKKIKEDKKRIKQQKYQIKKQKTKSIGKLKKRKNKDIAFKLTQILTNKQFDNFFNEPRAFKEIKVNKDKIKYLNKFKPNDNFRLIVQDGNNMFAYNERVKDVINGNIDFNYDDAGSDPEVLIDNINEGREITLRWVKINKTRKRGGYFKYYLKNKINLSRYQIFNNLEEANNDVSKLNCLQYALKEAGVKSSKFKKLLTLFIKSNDNLNITYNDKLPKKFIPWICNELEINITLSYTVNHKKLGDQIKKEKYPKNQPFDKTYEIGLLDEHYFLNEETIYTKDSIEKYDELKDKKDFNEYFFKSNRFRKDKSKSKINSFNLIRLLLSDKEKYLELITYENGGCKIPHKYKELKDYIDLHEPTDNECKLISEVKEANCPRIFLDNNNNQLPYDVITFDFEATTDEEIHKPYLVCSESRNTGIKRSFVGEYCALNFLKSLESNTLLIAHNMKYDLQFIISHLYQCKDYIPTGSKCKTISGIFHNKESNLFIRICVKDSLSLIPEPLRNFNKMFKLDDKKEIMPYSIYNKNTINEKFINIDLAKKELSTADYNEFNKNIIEWNLLNPNNLRQFDHIKYSKIYCEMDVSVLKQGYEIFRGWMEEITNLDIDYIISIPQLAYYYGVNEGVFKDIYEISGQAREFIQRCVVGGRTMCRDNKKWVVNEKVQDLDAVSLYPSAIYNMEGFLKGKPKVINNQMDYNFLKEQDGYFVEINILDIKKERHFPLISKVDDKGVRNFRNDIIGKGIYMDKQGLEDLIEFQEIEFEIIRGYYFNEGRNDTCKEFINKLYNERKIKKQQGNPIQTVYKLIMNSFYGKTIQNPIDHKYSFVYGEEKHDKTFDFNANEIICSTKIRDGMFMLKQSKSINKHFSLPHIGVEILSMSKHIMNEVICLAEDNDIDIFYQDTDSMHIVEDKVEVLAELFKKKYNRNLIGGDLGMFHCDFDFKCDKGTLPVSIKSLFIAKKTYIDYIMHIIDGIENFSYHIRMKGIPNKVITNFNLKNLSNEKDYSDVFDLYTDMFNGDKIEFDLLNICKFKTNKDFTFTNNKEFKRVLKF